MSDKCFRCKKPGTPYEHSCPVQRELNDNDEDFCNCCDDCTHECAMEV